MAPERGEFDVEIKLIASDTQTSVLLLPVQFFFKIKVSYLPTKFIHLLFRARAKAFRFSLSGS